MKTKKLIYWILPAVALIFQVGIFKFLDLVFSLEPNSPSPADILGNILLFILGVFLILIGYLIAYLYKKTKYKSIILVYGILFFFSLGVLVDSKAIIHYDYSATNAIWGVIVSCIKSIWIWNSYPIILSVLLYWYSKRIVYPEE